MAFGERLRFFRTKRGLTQKMMGIMMGYPEKSADIRVAQYEKGSRYPKDEVIEDLAAGLGVHPKALALPDIDSYIGLLHTFFALEDRYGIRVSTVEGEPYLFVDKTGNMDAAELHSMLLAWSEQAEKLENGEITREDYDRWRYRYPEFDTTKHWVKVPSKRFSDMMVKAFKNKLKD